MCCCENCGMNLPLTGKVCPHCGVKRPVIEGWFVALLLLIMLIGFYSFQRGEEEIKKEREGFYEPTLKLK